ncbi:MAG: NADP oxidoreductase [Archangium gephyra]|uniref:NADP oxidoreductase n=1 Tax=Archangium gephyra TaxID=48 RepID=A0A2W5UZ44_9BACT|nr:MAG: NADP oxidoreductase [Archangium gephyra]
MKLGIIGSGNIGQAIATLATRAGHEVVMSSRRGGASLNAVVRAVGEGATAGTVEEAAKADVVFLAVPWNAVEAATAGLTWHGNVVVDTTNPVLPGFLPARLGGRASSEVVAAMVPGAKLVKAFNTLQPSALVTQPVSGRRVLFMSGDDAAARATVAQLATEFGLAPVDLGPLAGAALLTQFPGGPLPALELVKL